MLRTQLALEGSTELFGPPGIITREFEAMRTGNKICLPQFIGISAPLARLSKWATIYIKVAGVR